MTEEQVKQAILQARVAISQWEKLCEEKIEHHKKEIRKIQHFNCKHESKTFNADPAGGHDSYYECNICGKEI